ncbi:hypothetical protein QNI23_016615 [Bermanella sp. WJH001]|uniref:hypothetical protein n=1 Tax=Bermanella sp. WJH001 TaxID=3048005 RepID=UPI0024BDB671|nr:hypothetical protein [Bermanella sp. WJH001]MDJ1538933.1 hypothetical protein [Bermanella sp. WJH001]
MKTNPFKKIEKYKNGCEIEMTDEDFQYFEDYKDFYNEFEKVLINENFDVNKKSIIKKLKDVTSMFVNKEISMNAAIRILKERKTSTDSTSNNNNNNNNNNNRRL